jgi:erythromycin esterase
MNRFRTFCLAAWVLLSPALCQTESRSLAWLEKNSVRMRTLAATDSDFTDLEPLAALIGNARIVLLGEESHGDGTTFLAKNRLIAFLHQRMGFDVLCFESGLYDCRKAWESLCAGEDPLLAMRRGIFPIWMESRQLEPLTDYVGKAARSPRPLELCGYDCQLTGSASTDTLISDLRALVRSTEHPVVSEETWASAEATLKSLLQAQATISESRSTAEASLIALSHALTSAEIEARHSPRDVAFFRQVLESLRGLLRHRSVSGREELSLAEQFNPRDEQGALNMLWLARTFYPDRKIIVWAASMHLLRDHEALDTLDPRLVYSGTFSMGHRLSAALGPAVFTMAFTAGGGEAGIVWGKRWKIPPARPGSFEDLCVKAGLENAVIPVSKSPDAPFHEILVARPLGYQAMKGDWKRHLDAFVFTKTMEPSKKRYSRAEIESSRDPVAAIARTAQEFRDKAAKGHPYAEKGDLEIEWTRWCDMFEPGPDARKEAIARIRAWAVDQSLDPSLTWRIHGLLSTLARDDHDLPTALREIDAALEKYPDTTVRDPSKQSSFQHLANAKAMILADTAGADEAIRWIAHAFENDARFHYFYAALWVERFSGDRKSLDKLRQTMAQAHDARAVLFPKEADRLRDYWKSSQPLWPQ